MANGGSDRSQRLAQARLVSRIAGVLVAAIGALDLVGWFFGIPVLTSVLSGLSTMKVNTALALIVAGVGLNLRVLHRDPSKQFASRRHLANVCGVAVALIGGLTLFEYATNSDLHIDQLIFQDIVTAAGSPYPGRMGLNTALSLGMVGLAILSMDWTTGTHGFRVADTLAIGAGWIALMALLGYAYSVESLVGFGSYTQMALHTSISIGALSVGLLSARPASGLIAIVTNEGVGSALARRLLPAAFIIPFVLGWVRLEGQRAGLYDTEMGIALFAAGNILLFGMFVYAAALSLNRTDLQRRDAEETLRAREERTDFALTAGGVGIWDADPDAGTVAWSEKLEAIHGLAPGTFSRTLVGFLDCIHPEDRDAVRATIETSLSTATDSRLEYRTIWPDGSLHWIVGQGRQVRTGSGDVSHIVGIGIDVTERKQLQNQLLQAQKMEAIGQLAGGVAHDFNNLLTAILGYSEMLALRYASDDSACKDISEISSAAGRATGLTRQLLAFSRRQILQPIVLDVNAVVTTAVSMLRRLVGEDIDLRLKLSSVPLTVTADPIQVEQVLMNLVVNGRDAMPSGGTLTIETTIATLDDAYMKQHGISAPATVSGAHVLLEVSDSGVGMDSETKRRIFEPFFTTKLPGQGTGLGLATVYGIVKQSGGFVWVYSELGKGTTFKVYLPCVDSPPQERVETPVVSEKPPGGSETLLLVEDEDSVRMLARTLLERSGYRVLEAPNPATAKTVCVEEPGPIDLLVTDVVMPGASGPELFNYLHELRPTMKVLYMSGYADEAIVHRGVLEPGVSFLQKPFSALGFARKVREVLDA